MANLTVINHVTLDGVMQAPGRYDEDARDGFEHGGWARALRRRRHGRVHGQGHDRGRALLFGRRTYEDFAAVWPKQEGNPISTLLNERQKYVASTTLQEPLPWVNSTLLQGDVAEAVARLKEEAGREPGRARQRRAAPDADAPRPRRRVRADDPPAGSRNGAPAVRRRRPRAALRLVESVTTTTGVLIAVYRPA